MVPKAPTTVITDRVNVRERNGFMLNRARSERCSTIWRYTNAARANSPTISAARGGISEPPASIALMLLSAYTSPPRRPGRTG